jgi:hypothetical protein
LLVDWIKEDRMEHVARTVEWEMHMKFSSGNLGGKKAYGRPKRVHKGNIKMYLQEIGCETGTWTELL